MNALVKNATSLFCWMLLATTSSFGQTNFTLKGRVLDAATLEGVPFASVASKDQKTGVTTDVDGYFSFRTNLDIRELKVSSLGYHTNTHQILNRRDSIIILLEPNVNLLKEVMVKPKKYRNKNNPTVELIKLVIEHRDENRVEGFNSFHEEQYEKILMGITDLSDGLKNKRMFRSWKAVTDNTDTTLLKGSGITPVYLQESVQDFYSKNNPKRSKIWVKATQKVKFPIIDNEGVEKYMRYLYEDANIYDDHIVLLTDHFISPISNNAPIFYRYYPVDTIQIEGSKVVRLQFFPRNKTDMLLQGEMYVALDSTFPVTRITYTINPNVNLNWVRTLEMDQIFKKLPSGKWVVAEENYSLDFGVFRKGSGIFAKRYVSHRNQEMGLALSDTLFQKNYELRSLLPSAEKTDTSFWAKSRHTALSATEARTYKAMDSLQNTMVFRRIVKGMYIATTGFVKPVPGLELGRVNTFYSFNPVEGSRLRFGARTNPDFSKRIYFEGYGAYGLKDERFKFGVSAQITLAKDRAYNRFPYNLLRINYQQDLLTPGVLIIGTFAPTSIATSLTRGTNDRFLFQKKFQFMWEREFYNHFSFQVGFEHRDLTPLGSLTFTPTDDVPTTPKNVVTATPFLQLRYAPGEEFYQTVTGWRTRIRFDLVTQLRYFKGISGIGGSQYNYHDLNLIVYKFFKVPPIGYNYFYVEAGGVFGKVPYPLLNVHRGNQTFGLRFMAYNLMNFMEFVSDRYVAVQSEHSFYGFILNKIPLVKKLKLREFVTAKVLYGQISEQNQPKPGSDLYELPKYPDGSPLTYSLEAKPYVEVSVGIGNIFRLVRLDLVRRLTYLEHPETAKYGVRVSAAVRF